MILRPGDLLGEYRIDAAIGEGGFATVYRGYQPSLNRVVAVKVLDERLSRDPGFVERFRREAEATYSLKHPNIVQVFDFREARGIHFLVMEFVDGLSLREVLRRQGVVEPSPERAETTQARQEAQGDATRVHGAAGEPGEITPRCRPLDMGLVAQIAAQVCAGLEHAHGQGIVHRDLKPDNVLLTRDGRALLSDFGIARVHEEPGLTRTGQRIGTAAYMSPEQILARPDVDHRSDIYSLGVVLYEMLTGILPFVGVEAAVEIAHLTEVPRRLTLRREGIPTALEQVVLRCLEKEPAARYASAREVSTAITTLVRPVPFVGLLRPEQAEEATPEEEQEAGTDGTCPRCGNSIDPEKEGVACPVCGRRLGPTEGREQRNAIERKAHDLLASFRLKPGLALAVRDYEYTKTIEPSLRERFAAAVSKGEKALEKGVLVGPLSEATQRPNESLLLDTSRELLELADLWDAPAMDEYVVSLDARRDRRKATSELRGRAYLLFGLSHSLRGAGGLTHAEMVAGYEGAREWHRRAAETLGAAESEMAEAAHQAGRWAEAILLHPSDAEESKRRLMQLAGEFQEVDRPWAREATSTCRFQAGSSSRVAQELRQSSTELQARLSEVNSQTPYALKGLEELRARAREKAAGLSGKVAAAQRAAEHSLKWVVGVGLVPGILLLALWGRGGQRWLLPSFGVVWLVAMLVLLAVAPGRARGAERQENRTISFSAPGLAGLFALGALTIITFVLFAHAAFVLDTFPKFSIDGLAVGIAVWVLSFAFVLLLQGRRALARTEKVDRAAQVRKDLEGELQKLAESAVRAQSETYRNLTDADTRTLLLIARLTSAEEEVELANLRAGPSSAQQELQRLRQSALDLRAAIEQWKGRATAAYQQVLADTSGKTTAGTQPLPSISDSSQAVQGGSRPATPDRDAAAPSDRGGVVTVKGGWKLPTQGLLGCKGDALLSAEVYLDVAEYDVELLVNRTMEFYRDCRFQVETLPEARLRLARGSRLGKALGISTKGLPAEMEIQFRFDNSGATISLMGRVETKGQWLDDLQELVDEFDGYVRMLQSFRPLPARGPAPPAEPTASAGAAADKGTKRDGVTAMPLQDGGQGLVDGGWTLPTRSGANLAGDATLEARIELDIRSADALGSVRRVSIEYFERHGFRAVPADYGLLLERGMGNVDPFARDIKLFPTMIAVHVIARDAEHTVLVIMNGRVEKKGALPWNAHILNDEFRGYVALLQHLAA